MGKINRKSGIPVFGQLLSFIPRQDFNKIVHQLQSDRYTKNFTSWDHVVTMIYAVVQKVGGLRELCSGMAGHNQSLKHLGMKSLPTRSNLSDRNRNRSPKVFEQLFFSIYKRNRLFLTDSSLSKNEKWLSDLFLIDSTTITLFKNIMKACGNAMANGRRKGGVKIHCGMWLKEQVPSLIRITKAAESDKNFMVHFKNMPAKTILVFDKAYVNYALFIHWIKTDVSFVSRLHKRSIVAKGNLRLLTQEDETYGILEDCDVQLGHKAQKNKVAARLITFCDKINNRKIEFITNNKKLDAWEIADIYKQRWQIELLFKRLKQNIKITSFLGDNENAIHIQIWCALIADLLMQIARKGRKKGKMAYSVVCGLLKLHLMNYVQITDLLLNPADPSIFNQKSAADYDLFHQGGP